MIVDQPSTNFETPYGQEFSQKSQLWELLVFLFLIVPSMGMSFFLARRAQISFVLVALATMFRDLALVSLVSFFLWRNGERAARIGWRLNNWFQDVLLGAVLFLPVSSGIVVVDTFLRKIGFTQPSTPLPRFLSAQGFREIVLAAILVAVVAVSEEIIFRGYLILRLSAVTRSTMAAVILSSIIFSLGHGYEGSAGAVSVGVMGLVFALIYLWRGSLVAPIVMHFLQDFIGIVLPPLLRHR
jgi:membrane protease YdiL (CAAX protease family)